MFKSHHLIIFLISTYSNSRAAIFDEAYLNKNGPYGMITFQKNDSFVDWVRVPEASYQQWKSTLKIWRTTSIVLGLLCLIFAASVLAYVIHSFQSDTPGPFDCCGETKPDDEFLLSNGPLPINVQQLALQRQLKQAEQREQEAQREKYEAARRLSAMLRYSAVPARTTINPIAFPTALK